MKLISIRRHALALLLVLFAGATNGRAQDPTDVYADIPLTRISMVVPEEIGRAHV